MTKDGIMIFGNHNWRVLDMKDDDALVITAVSRSSWKLEKRWWTSACILVETGKTDFVLKQRKNTRN